MSIAASIAQGRSSTKLCLAHELHELLFGHLDLLVGHITLVSKDRICNTLQVDIANRAARTVINLKERLAETFAQKSIDDLLSQSILGALVKQDIGGAPQP